MMRAGVTHSVQLRHDLSVRRLYMEDRAPVVPPTEQSTEQSTTSPTMHKHEGRGAWVLTAYSISGLALFGVLAYFFSEYVAH